MSTFPEYRAMDTVRMAGRINDNVVYVTYTDGFIGMPLEVNSGKLRALKGNSIIDVLEVILDGATVYRDPPSDDSIVYHHATTTLEMGPDDTEVTLTLAQYAALANIDMSTMICSRLITDWERAQGFKAFSTAAIETVVSESLEDVINTIQLNKEFKKTMSSARTKTVLDEDIRTEITATMNAEVLTSERLRRYLFARHELTVRELQRLLRVAPEDSDVPFSSIPDFRAAVSGHPDINKSPDIYINTGQAHRFVEVLVTDGDVQDRIRGKVAKYQQILADFSIRNPTKPAELIVVAIRLTGPSRDAVVISCFPQTFDFEIDLHHVADELRRANDLIQSRPNYELLRSMIDNFEIESAVDLKMATEIRTMENAILAKMIPDISAPSILTSYDKSLGRRWQETDMTLTSALICPSEEPMDVTTMAKTLWTKHEERNFGPEISAMVDQLREPTVTISAIDAQIALLASQMDNAWQGPRYFKMPAVITSDAGVDWTTACVAAVRILELEDGAVQLKLAEKFRFEATQVKPSVGIDLMRASEVEAALSVLFRSREAASGSLRADFETSWAFDVMKMWEEMAMEIFLLSERRYVARARKGTSIFKRYKHFSLLINAGNKAKSDAQLVVKVFVNRTDSSFSDLGMFRPLVETPFMILESDWFSIQLADLKHFTTVASRARVIMSDYEDKMKEAIADRPEKFDNALSFASMVPMIVLMSHKRNLSTCLQMARYAMHSCTGLLTDTSSLASEVIDAAPIRDEVHALVALRMLQWMREIKSNPLFKALPIGTLDPMERGIMDLPSMFDATTMVPFSVIMLEIYYSNLFNPESGMNAHRQKAIMDKMIKVEKEYRARIQERSLFAGFEEVYSNKSKFCQMCPEVMAGIMDYYMMNPNVEDMVVTAVNKSMRETLMKVVKMTRSVVGIRDDILAVENMIELIPKTKSLKKCTVFEACMKILTVTSEPDLVKILHHMNKMEAVFSTFAKPQIGGAREILIQTITTRIQVAIFNSFFEAMCEFHPKEMVTKEHKKREILSRAILEYSESVASTITSSSTDSGLMFTINSDASKWAQNQVMHWYWYFLSRIEQFVPKTWLAYMHKVLSSFANKKVYIPQTTMDKLGVWSEEMISSDPVMASVREFASDTGLMTLHSGMGQGNLQHASSFMHAVILDYTQAVAKRYFMTAGVRFDSTVLVSSDDSTEVMRVLTSGEGARESAIAATTRYFSIRTAILKSAGIITNFKKTALQQRIGEFNSTFFMADTMYWATGKDAYNAIHVPDLTKPLFAASSLMSSIRRLLDGGCYLPTIDVAISEANRQLRRFYDLEEVIPTLERLFDCPAAELPADFGQIPTMYPMSTLLYGMKIHEFTDNPKLKKFYEVMNSDFAEEVYLTSLEVGDLDITTRCTIEMSSRADKQLQELKKTTLKALGFNSFNEILDREFFSIGDNPHNLLSMKKMMANYVATTKRTYGFSSSMEMHSLVRAKSNKKMVRVEGVSEEYSSMVDFAAKVLLKSDFTTFLPIFSTFSVIKTEAERLEASIDRDFARTRSIRPRQKYRRLALFDNDNFGTITEGRLIRSIFSKDPNVKYKTLRAINVIAAQMGIDQADFLRSPMSSIKKKAGSRANRLLEYVIRVFCKELKSKEAMILSPQPTTSSRFSDLKMLRANRSIPGKIILSLDSEADFESEMNIQNMLTFSTKDELMTSNDLAANTKTGAAIKLWQDYCKGDASSNNYFSRYPLFSEKVDRGDKARFTRYWMDNDTYVTWDVDTATMRSTLLFYGSKDSQLCGALYKDMVSVLFTMPTMRITFEKVDDSLVRDFSLLKFVSDNSLRSVRARRKINFEVDLRRKEKGWVVIITMGGMSHKLAAGQYKYYPGAKTQPVGMAHLLEVVKDPSLESIDDFISCMKSMDIEMKRVSKKVTEIEVGNLVEAGAFSSLINRNTADMDASHDLFMANFMDLMADEETIEMEAAMAFAKEVDPYSMDSFFGSANSYSPETATQRALLDQLARAMAKVLWNKFSVNTEYLSMFDSVEDRINVVFNAVLANLRRADGAKMHLATVALATGVLLRSSVIMKGTRTMAKISMLDTTEIDLSEILVKKIDRRKNVAALTALVTATAAVETPKMSYLEALLKKV